MVPAPALALGAAVAFGCAGILMKRGMQYATPLTATLFSVVVTAAVIWALAVTTLPLSLLLTWKVLPFAAAGLLAPGLARLAFFTGVDRIGASRASSIATTAPLFAVLFAFAFVGERPTWMLVLGGAVVVGGAALLARRERTEKRWRRRDLMFPALGAIGFGFRDALSRYGFLEFPYPILGAAVATAMSVAVISLAVGVRRGLTVHPAGTTFLVVAGLFEGLAYIAMWTALSRAHVAVVSPLVQAQALFTVILAALFLRDLERVTWRIVVGCGLVVTGVALVILFRTP